MITDEDMAAVAKIEERLAQPGVHLPKTAAEMAWLCALVRKAHSALQQTPSSELRQIFDAKAKEMAAEMGRMADAIAELELELGHTPDKVFAAERAQGYDGA